MDNLYFPQLMSGALAQFPIIKTRLARTIKNILPDGSMILSSDPSGEHLVWELAYTALSTDDTRALQALFGACAGPFHAFTFIDPTDNMLAFSSNLGTAPWQTSSAIQLSPGLLDPDGGTAGVTATNTGQAQQEISQSLAVPANYQYCFSLYAVSAQPGELVLIRRGTTTEESTTFAIGPSWNRIVASGQLNDPGTTFAVAISLSPGQQVGLYGIQLEAQAAPSRYRATTHNGGVYANAHWAIDQFTIVAEAPNLFSTSISIESAI